ncbi:hypothetical protein M758_11G051300 [Ceratodon purpureus]|uniref:BTB domain-containing protein n=1 Tax=Ceratodon purpureus TaxID=3225 RepID=A0A8T0GAP6_CERPU|nr:hypothetical protein KC19_11G052800 [Ceratodon purpureus]KAG0600658.1 hypothetical protein M758_11G051300 [Ceratodon purpureus]
MDDPGAVAMSSASTERGVSSLESCEHENARGDGVGGERGEMSSVVRLNVGGMMFATTVDTLTQRDTDSMLAVMFSGRHRLHVDSKKGAVFIDRDGTHFRHILNWLRDGVIPMLEMPAYQELLREAEYYQLIGLVDNIAPLLCKKDEDDNTKPEMSRRDVIKYLQFGKVRLRGVNLSGQNLSKLDLSNVDLSHTHLINTFFSRAKLQNSDFTGSEANGANFHYANLFSCQFTGAGMVGAVLAGANLQSANLADARLMNASLCNADLRGAHLQNADLTNANLSEANLENANLKGTKLSGANLRGANLQRAYLRDVNLKDTILEGASLNGANLQGASR